jgi:hypothetical protein
MPFYTISVLQDGTVLLRIYVSDLECERFPG